MNIDTFIAQCHQALVDFPEIILVYLFGSQVTGNTGPMSDIDVAVLYDASIDELDTLVRFQHALKVSLETGIEIDVVSLKHVPIELAFNVIASGKAVYQRSTADRVDYEAKIMGLYYDYLPVLRAQREQILRGDDYGKRVQRYREALRRTERTFDAVRKFKKQDEC